MMQACTRTCRTRALIANTRSGASAAALCLGPKQVVAWRRGMACCGWQGWAEGGTSTADDRTSGTSSTREYLRNSEHDSAHTTYSSSSGNGFPSFDDVPDFFSSNPTYQPAPQHDSAPTYSANHHDRNASNGSGYSYNSNSWDSSPSHHSTANGNADAFHASSYEEAGGGFFYDQGSHDASGDSTYDFYPSSTYGNGRTASSGPSGSTSERAYGASPSSTGYSASGSNGVGGYSSSYHGASVMEDSGPAHADEPQRNEQEEEEEEEGGGGFFNPAFAAALQAALQRSAQSESESPLTSQASYQEDEVALSRTPQPLPRREEEPSSASVDVLSAAFDASMTSINRLMAIKGEVERAIEREKLQLARLEFALDKTKKDEAYYRVLRVMQERGVSDVEDM